MRAVYKMEPSS